MKTTIIAIAPDDGWAFFTREGKAFVICPPYHAYDLIEVLEKDAEKAVDLRGFEKCDCVFCNMEEAIGFLKDKYIEAMRNKAIDPPFSEELKDMLKSASDDILLGYLEKAERRLIPAGKIDAAMSIANVILPLKQSWNNRQVYTRAMSLFEECCRLKSIVDQIVAVMQHRSQLAPSNGREK